MEMDIHLHVYSRSRLMINRPGVAGAVLQTHSSLINSLIDSLSDAFTPDLQNINRGSASENI